jgi:hypothetical protein
VAAFLRVARSVPSARGDLRVSHPQDACEQEAEKVADAVMRDGLTTTVGSAHGGVAQRKALGGGACPSAPAGPEQEEPEETPSAPVMAMRAGVAGGAQGGGAAPQAGQLAAAVRTTGPAGAPLPRPARAFFEPRLGHSFADVRVHTDGAATRLAGSIDAAAFTVGRDIYFGRGAYAPETTAGRRLLAHELAHVVQQRRGDRSLQRYSLRGFPPAEEAAMKAAIPVATAKVRACGALSWWGRRMTRLAINDRRYDYEPKLGLCGWTYPGAHYIEIGKEAFSPSICCDLASTIAHEASHTQLYTEGRARRLECKCFGCSC